MDLHPTANYEIEAILARKPLSYQGLFHFDLIQTDLEIKGFETKRPVYVQSFPVILAT